MGAEGQRVRLALLLERAVVAGRRDRPLAVGCESFKNVGEALGKGCGMQRGKPGDRLDKQAHRVVFEKTVAFRRYFENAAATVPMVRRAADQALALKRLDGLGSRAARGGEPCGHDAGLTGKAVGAR